MESIGDGSASPSLVRAVSLSPRVLPAISPSIPRRLRRRHEELASPRPAVRLPRGTPARRIDDRDSDIGPRRRVPRTGRCPPRKEHARGTPPRAPHRAWPRRPTGHSIVVASLNRGHRTDSAPLLGLESGAALDGVDLSRSWGLRRRHSAHLRRGRPSHGRLGPAPCGSLRKVQAPPRFSERLRPTLRPPSRSHRNYGHLQRERRRHQRAEEATRRQAHQP